MGAANRAGVDGVVTEWDDARGWGTVRTADGHEVALQCTNLTDGSRTTETGRRLRVTVEPGHHGRWQAVRAEPLSA